MVRKRSDDYFDDGDGEYDNDNDLVLTRQRRTVGGQRALWPTSQSSSWVRTLTSSPGEHFSSLWWNENFDIYATLVTRSVLFAIWNMNNVQYVKSWYDYHDRVCLVTIFVQLWWWYHLENTMHYICQTSPASLVVIFFNPKTASLVWHGTAQRAPHALYPVAQKRRQGKGPRTGKDFAVIACICMTKTMNWPLAACYQFCPSRRTIWYSSDWNGKGYRNCFDPTWTW